MKKLFILFIFISLAIPVLAQTNPIDESKTLFGSDWFKGGYACPEVKLTNACGHVGGMLGGRAGWIVNSTFSIGVGGYVLISNQGSLTMTNINGDLSTNYRNLYGGLFLNYALSSNEVIHFTINALIGGGSTTYNEFWTRSNNVNLGWDNYFVFEPGIGVELNVLKFFRIELGGSYRIVAGLDMQNANRPEDVGGYSGNLAFKFGNF